jgi:tetratricopeptide (TPR) repeat protein
MKPMVAFTHRAGLPALILVLAAGLLAAPSSFAQGTGQGKAPTQGQQQPPPQQPPAQPAQPAQPEAPPVNPEEEAAYKVLFDAPRTDFQKQVELGEDFLKKFAESRYRESVYSKLANAYFQLQDLDKASVAGEKALELNPENVDVLALMVYLLPRAIKGGDLDADQKLRKTEEFSKRATELLEAMAKPEGLTEDDFTKAKNEKLSMCHSGLGLAYLHQQRWKDSITELEQATKLAVSPDATDYYLLALAYQQTGRFTDAAGAFGKCGEMQWAWQDRCKQGVEQARRLAAAQPKP